MSVRYVRETVPVAGGELTVGVWGDRGPLVVAAHGLTATHQAWLLVGPDLGRDHRFVAPDLRGRGGSRLLPPPYGVTAHAADLAAVVAAYGGGPAVLVGHSMGGLVVVRATRDHPGLVSRAVLVDGGAPFPLPEGAGEQDAEQVVAAVLGPAFARLSMTFPSRAAAREFWQAHPSFADWSEAMAAYVDYDLVGQEPELRPACRPEAAARDAHDLFPLGGDAPAPLRVPGAFLRAGRGMLDQPDQPVYPPGWPSHWLPDLPEITLADLNHYTITLAPAGAAAVAAAVRAEAAQRVEAD
jgi:pimeloyl-ACP methyl ester carboxylesterase